MKLGENLYVCDWCGHQIKAVINKFFSSVNESMPWTVRGKQNVSDNLKCPKCHRFVSQKAKLDLNTKKFERRF